MNDPLGAESGVHMLRFGIFELDLECAEVRRRGLRVHLQEMPFKVLTILVARPGELVRREDFFARLWPNDALGILDDNLNTAVGKLRVALGDSARNPRFIETIPRRGYRFIAPVRAAAEAARADLPAEDVNGNSAPPISRTGEPELSRVSSLFVGRRREMDELKSALLDCREGRRHLVLVCGEAGIGKTRIAERLAAEARVLGTSVVWGRSLEERGGQPYWSWVQILRAMIQPAGDEVLRQDMGAFASDIAAIVPELSARLAVAPSEALENAEQNRFRLFESITGYLRQAARRQPLMLVFDNLQWAGQPSLLLFEFVAQSLVDSPVLFLGTYRNSEVPRHHPLFNTLGTLNRESRFLRLELGGLEPEAVATFLELASGSSPSCDLTMALHRQTEGNPFFVSEVARLLISERVLAPANDDVRPGHDSGAAPAATSGATIRIPQGIREVIGRRLNRLSAECNEMLDQAAVVGREFDLAVLRMLLGGMQEDTLFDALEEGLAAGVIQESRQSANRYRFNHALIRETLYDEVSVAHRARDHAHVGQALERLSVADPNTCLPQLAHHFSKAACCGHAARAVRYCTRAGENAEAVLAYEEAVGFYQMALEALEREEPLDRTAQCRLLLAAARSMSKGGHVAETLDFVQRAAECCRRLGYVDGLVDACQVIDYIVANLGVAGHQALPLIEETIAAVGDEDSATRASLLGALTRACYTAGMPERGQVAMHESLEMARRVGDPEALISALRARTYVHYPAEDIDERLKAAREMLHLAERLGDESLQREAHDMCFFDLFEKGELDEADRHLLHAGRLGKIIRQPFHAHNHLIYRTMRTVLQGNYEEGEKLALEALAAGQRIRRDSAEGIFGLQIFTIRRDQGRLRELAEVLRAFTRERPASTIWRPGLALMYSELGLADEARAELEQLARDDFAMIPRDVLWPTCLAYLAEVADFVQDRAVAGRLYELLRPYDGHALVVGACVACLGAASYYLGMVACCLGQTEAAATHYSEALQFNERIGARPWLARTQQRLGALLSARESAATLLRSRQLLDASLVSARELGMGSLVQKIGPLQNTHH